MISAPVDDSGLSLAQIFDQPNVMMAVWLPATSKYVVSPTFPADTLRPAQGYWARFYQPTNLLQRGVPTIPGDSYSIALSTGWNLIGNPRTTAVPESGVTIVNGDSDLTFTQAVNDTLVYSTLFTWAQGDVAYQQESDPSITFAPFTGYWLYAYDPVTLTFPATAQ
jgi:hypothetical protein